MRAGTVGARCGVGAPSYSQARSSAPVSSATSKARRNSSGVGRARRVDQGRRLLQRAQRQQLVDPGQQQLAPPARIDRGGRPRPAAASGTTGAAPAGRRPDRLTSRSRDLARQAQRPTDRAAGPTPPARSAPPHRATGRPAPWSPPVPAGHRPASVTGGSSMPGGGRPAVPQPPASPPIATASRWPTADRPPSCGGQRPRPAMISEQKPRLY